MNTTQIVELSAAAVMLIGVIGVIAFRLPSDKGLGVRVIQFVAVVTILPGILILALEKVLTGETTATLFGTITGYLLSGIGEIFKQPVKDTVEKKDEKPNAEQK